MPYPSHRRALAGGVAVLALLVFTACGSDEDAGDPANEAPGTSAPSARPAGTSAAPTTGTSAPDALTIVASVAGGAPSGGARTETVALDEPVRIEVTGDAADEIHVHTYDLFEDVGPGAPAVFEFTADIPGVHEVELHSTGQVLLELQVEP